MNKTLTLIACSALVLGAIAAPALAQPDEREGDEAQKGHDRRDAARERQADFREAHAACKEARHNETNATQGDCVSDAAKAKHEPAHQARRAYHHLEKQIGAVEHRIAKMEMMEYRTEAALESGELNETQSAKANATLERIDHAQGELVKELRELYQKLKDLKERWQDHKDDRVRPYPRDAPETDASD